MNYVLMTVWGPSWTARAILVIVVGVTEPGLIKDGAVRYLLTCWVELSMQGWSKDPELNRLFE